MYQRYNVTPPELQCNSGVQWSLIFFAPVHHNLFDVTFQIIDSIMALFRVDFSGRGELADRQQKLAQLLSKLQKISEGEVATSRTFVTVMQQTFW